MKKLKSKSKIKNIKINLNELNLDQPLGRFLISLFRLFEDELILELHKLGFIEISVSDFNVLRFIDPKGIQATEIAKLAGVSKQAMSKQIRHLEIKGLIKRHFTAKDSRAQIIQFSAKGKNVIEASIKIILEIEKKYEKIIGINNLEQLKKHLNLIILDYIYRALPE